MTRVGNYHKYGAKKCGFHQPPHASLRECARYRDLVLMEKAGEIRRLRQQVRIPLCDCQKPLVYIADFVYEEHVTTPCSTAFHATIGAYKKCQKQHWRWRPIIEDSKGVLTDVFRVKKHLLKDKGIEVRLS